MKNSPLFTIGDLSQVGIVRKSGRRKSGRTFDTMQENTSRTGPPEFAKSPNRWSLYLKSISIDENFEALSIDENEIYFISIAWDYSGLSLLLFVLGFCSQRRLSLWCDNLILHLLHGLCW